MQSIQCLLLFFEEEEILCKYKKIYKYIYTHKLIIPQTLCEKKESLV